MTFRLAGTRQLWPSTVLGLATLVACSGPGPAPATAPASPDAMVHALQVVSGNAQSAPVKTTLPTPLRVQVCDANGHPVPNVVVNFIVTSGGGHVYGGSEETDAQGEAYEIWTLGPRLGPQTVDVRAVDRLTGAEKDFGHFTATALPPHNIQVAIHNSAGLALMNADGTDTVQITSCAACHLDVLPVLSPDHGHAVFVGQRGLSPLVSVTTMAGVVLHTLFTGSNVSPDQSPSYSPDGTLIVTTADRGGPLGTYLLVYDTAGTQVANLGGVLAGCGCDRNAAFSADGTKLVFESTRNGEADIYTVNFAGGALDRTSVVQLTFNGGSQPAWSPDGHHVAFTHHGDTYVMDPDGNNQKAITTGGQGVGLVSWSPDSQLIGGSTGLMNADGTNLVKINGGAEGRFAWR
jgi:Tol biopolymer transport system component